MSQDRCAVCQREVQLRWHCTSRNLLDRAECRAAGGVGVWLCGTCEEAAHRHMRLSRAGSEAAVLELLARLEAAFAQRRTYRKKKEGEEQ